MGAEGSAGCLPWLLWEWVKRRIGQVCGSNELGKEQAERESFGVVLEVAKYAAEGYSLGWGVCRCVGERKQQKRSRDRAALLVVESFSAPRASGPSGRSDDVPPALRERPPGASGRGWILGSSDAGGRPQSRWLPGS